MQCIVNNGDRIIKHFTNKKAVRKFHPTLRKRNVFAAHYKYFKKNHVALHILRMVIVMVILTELRKLSLT